MARSFGREELIARLRAVSPTIVPSLLLCDFANLQQEIERLEAAGVAALHFDVMDGHFVPNLTYGMTIVEAARRVTDLPFDVHLMIENPEEFIADFRAAGANIMTIHAEAVVDPRPVLEEIRSLGALAGLAINPPTPLADVEACLSYCDLILTMSVMPGFGGQEFDDAALAKLRELRGRDDVAALLEIDGGINAATVGKSAEAGAELLVAGSAIFRSDDYTAALRQMQDSAIAGAGA
jgi:ribulose-phosphate 3-epimerase